MAKQSRRERNRWKATNKDNHNQGRIAEAHFEEVMVYGRGTIQPCKSSGAISVAAEVIEQGWNFWILINALKSLLLWQLAHCNRILCRLVNTS